MNRSFVALTHAATQTVTGVVVGSIVDSVFPDPDDKVYQNNTDALYVFGEVVAQTAVVSLLASAFYAGMNELSITNQDPANGFAYTLALLAAQPKLTMKISNLAGWVGGKVDSAEGSLYSNLDLLSTPTPTKSTTKGAQAQINN